MTAPYSFTAAQREAIGSLEESVYVPAGAGSGKTAVLVERFLNIVTNRKPSLRARVDEVLTLTFTDKAAIEMKRRIRQELRARGLEGELRSMEAAYIGTIHSFCARLIRENAFAANVDPGFEVLDEVFAPMLLEKALADCLEEGSEELHRLALRYGEDCVAETLRRLLRLLKTRGFSQEDVRQSAADVELLHRRMRGEMEQEVLRFQKMAADQLMLLEPIAVGGASDGPLAKLVFAIKQFTPGCLDGASVSQVGSALSSLRRPPIGGKLRAALAALREEFNRVEPYLALDEAREKEAALHERALLLAALDLMLRYDAAKRQRPALDFDDLQQRARDLLRASPHLRDRYRSQFRYIMVDEFQDTNPLQGQIVDLLRRPKKLFVVGDAKQSIYGFRDADVGIFLEYERKLCADEEGKRIALLENFRSRPALIHFINRFFAELWRGEDFPFEPLEPTGNFEPKGEPSVEVMMVRKSDEASLDRCRLTEAHLVAERLRDMVTAGSFLLTRGGESRPLCYGDFALLFRASTSMHLYERVFREHGIPHHVSSGRGFYQSQELADLTNLLVVVDNPFNDIPLVSVLRSPFVGVSEDTLFLIRRSDQNEGAGARVSFYEALLARRHDRHIGANDRAKVAVFLGLLNDLRARRMEVGPGTLVREALERTRYNCKLLMAADARRRLANVQRLVELADAFQAREPFNLRAFLDYLHRVSLAEPRETQAPIEPVEGMAVEFLTIHAAKGLEFPVVVIPDMGRRFGGASRGRILVSKDYLVTPKYVDPLSGQATETASSHLASRRAQEAAFAEEKRLLYVAMTRAVDHLILVGSTRRDDLKPISHASSPMDWVRIILQLSLDADRLLENPHRDEDGRQVVQFGSAEVLVRSTKVRPMVAGQTRTGRLIDRVGRWVAEGAEIPEGDGIAFTQTLLEEAECAAHGAEPLPPPRRPVPRYSVTGLLTYADCPREYLLRFVYGLPPRAGSFTQTAPAGAGDALAFGNIFHSVMRFLDLSKDPLEQLALLEPRGGLPQELWEKVRAGVAGFWNSHLFPALQSASIVLREQPFSLRLDGAVLTGVVDLLVRTPDGQWWVVDYKTDRIDGTMVQERAENYRRQVETYAYACGRIIGAQVSRVLIFFAQPQVWWEGEMPAATMQAVESSLQGLVRSVEGGGFPSLRSQRCQRCGYDGLHCP